MSSAPLTPDLALPASPKDARTFPFATTFSLRRLIAYWKRTANDDASPWAPLAHLVCQHLEEAKGLEAARLDRAALSEHADLVDLMMSAVFPRARWEEDIAAVMPLYQAEVYYATPTCTRLGLFTQDAVYRRMSLDLHGFELGRTMMAYYLVLEHCYGVEVPYAFPLVLTLAEPRTRLERHFKLDIDTRFAWVEADDPPPLGDADRDRLLARPTDRALWEAVLPPERFVLHGFGAVTAVDVTDTQAVSALKNELLQRDGLTSASGHARLETHLRSLLRCPDLHLGLLCLEDGTLDDTGLGDAAPDAATRRVRPVGRSLLLASGDAPFCPDRGASVYAEALDRRTRVVVGDLAARAPQTGYESHLLGEGIASFVVDPLQAGDRTVGLLELGSPTAGALNAFNTMRLKEVTSLFATALRRSLDEREDHIQAVIKTQCTAVHPVVEWRFREAALRFLDATAADGERRMEPIVFPEVYPLYGLSDIRGSSTHRTAAIATDLREQLSLAFAVLVEASVHRSLPGLDELGYRLQRFTDELERGLSAEHEVGVVEFLQGEVEGLFDHLAHYGARVRERVAAYRAALDARLGMRYHARRAYDEAVAEINEAISCHLDRQEHHAQTIVPHYFEKYKTDGVEHNIYVGASLLRGDASPDPLALRSLRLWQLMTMCGAAWALDRIAPRLALPLETAHLILVQDAPLAIRFRYDEKHFDVDGAYNTRYEIVKKRIDKATVAGTGERLTQPGMLAVVYAQSRSADEYRAYFDYLRAAGYLGPSVEEVALEPMPGVTGLRALRVPIAERPPGMELDVTPERTHEAALSLSVGV